MHPIVISAQLMCLRLAIMACGQMAKFAVAGKFRLKKRPKEGPWKCMRLATLHTSWPCLLSHCSYGAELTNVRGAWAYLQEDEEQERSSDALSDICHHKRFALCPWDLAFLRLRVTVFASASSAECMFHATLMRKPSETITMTRRDSAGR